MSSPKQGYARLPFSWHEDDVMWEVLSGEAVRLFVAMTLESALNLSDGWISARQTMHLARDNHDAIDELIEYEYLAKETREVRKATLPGYLLVAFTAEQKTRAEREQEMASNRERQQRSRARKSKPPASSAPKSGARDASSSNGAQGSPVTRDITAASPGSHETSRSSSRSEVEVEVKNPSLASRGDVTSSSPSVRGASRGTDDGVGADAPDASHTGHVDGHLHNSHNSDSGLEDFNSASAQDANTEGYLLPASPFEDQTKAPPRGRPAEVQGSGNYDRPLLVSQALRLVERRISPELFVTKSRRLVVSKGWEHLDWAELVERERHSKPITLRRGEAEALMPTLRAWESEGAR